MDCLHESYYTIEKIRGLHISRCSQCDLIITTELYKGTRSTEYNQSKEALVEYEQHYLPHRIVTYKKFLPTLAQYRMTNKVLDFGCGYGHFLSMAKAEAWQVEGIESSDYDARIAKKQKGLVVYRDLNDQKLQKESFDVITLWDAIEHILDFKELIERLKELLRPGGVILIKTPNASIFNYKKKLIPEKFLHFYRSYIYPSNPRQHIYHFIPEYLIDVLRYYGFDNFQVNENELFSERVTSGNNYFVRLARYFLTYIAWRMNLPFEFVLTCEKKI